MCSRVVLLLLFALFALFAASFLLAVSGPPGSAQVSSSSFETGQGRLVLQFDRGRLAGVGLAIDASLPDSRHPFPSRIATGFGISEGSSLRVNATTESLGTLEGGCTTLAGTMTLYGPFDAVLRLEDPTLISSFGADGTHWTIETEEFPVLEIESSSVVTIEPVFGRLHWEETTVSLTREACHALGLQSLDETRVIGAAILEASIRPTDGSGLNVPTRFTSDPETAGVGSIGPDVIVGDLPSTGNWGAVDGIRAYSVATTSCNVGDENLDWIAEENRHPVIAQNLYRLLDGRFEQIGQSWLKHGFYALSRALCFNDCQSTDGTQLGIHCSDPYTASLNGLRSGLGPRSEVNPTTGDFPYPPTQVFSDPITGRRLRVDELDVDPSLNPAARYFIEGHYIAPDDAAAGNGLNNASYREVIVQNSNFNLVPIGETVRELPAIYAWQAVDPEVNLSLVDVLDDGRFHVGSRATDLGGGTWRYDYAVYNLNSHRSARSFRIPLPDGAIVTSVAFHDSDSHSGEPYSTADWQGTVGDNEILWKTDSFSTDPQANAIRWGTLYSFSFTCDVVPDDSAEAGIGLFRTGLPIEVVVAVVAPNPAVSLDQALAGTVDASSGPSADVLLINGSAGGASRTVLVVQGVSLTLDIMSPPSAFSETSYVIYGYGQLPTQDTVILQPMGIGYAAMPTVLSGGEPAPHRVANTFPAAFDGLLGVNRWPVAGLGKAPARLLDLSNGLHRSISIFFQGLIVDTSSTHGKIAVTNGITLVVQ